jgi:hypothetical protein
MTLIYPSTSNIDLMTAVLAGLSGAAINVKNSDGSGPVIASSVSAVLSSSPGFTLPDGTIIVRGSSIGYYYDGSGGIVNGGSVDLGGIINIPVVAGPVALLAVSTDKYVYFLGAVILPPVGSSKNSNY